LALTSLLLHRVQFLIVYLARDLPVGESFLIAVSIAVALIPEGKLHNNHSLV
jgi:hypothetical protein